MKIDNLDLKVKVNTKQLDEALEKAKQLSEVISEIDKKSDKINKLFATKDYNYSEAIKVIQEELRKDKSGGSLYHGWQSNIACIIMDNSDVKHEKANKIACKFLNRLIGNDEA